MAKKFNLVLGKESDLPTKRITIEEKSNGEGFALLINNIIVFSLWENGKYCFYPEDLENVGFVRAK